MPGAKKSNRRGPKKVRARRGRKGNRDVPDMASLSCTRSMVTAQNTQFGVNGLYNLMNTQLTDYPRAVQVAAAYQHYRIKKITLRFKPSYDTFTAGGVQTKPLMYWMIDKSGSVPTNASLEALKNMGAKPRQFDENDIVVSWKPSVLESVMYASGGVGAGSSSKYKVSPWLTTTANNVSPGAFVASGIDHLGIYWFLQQVAPVASGYQYAVECEVQFQFKKPLINLIGTTEAVSAKVAEINDSPDGIVGGGDGY